ncbi:1-deoxy-D-xylulose-5-phosphate synthase [Moraxella nonliquefaciens]|uniref:1-deoxy-D-xylulose-5-phosphate synthase n=1 Tax=Moraxella nonliquefaciens TaxID=478 RepID=A0A1B8QM59_MORNO|nr:1-deoxy-D-xylulose-5-phosphate synthase [Moraxella nonliquefaciens]OBX84943.1 1-deoxy-D-xylulose-5-phosphate synthase [Moraxella nonliquefaciens]QPT45238.1 1-deoxy-D-xylulose-5-phosphate synthase [Moraxella nonliquefaciens]QQC30270.1 1-deoxy-D-xylulose-5-phosphate synthase [Moraxella nonliquefaciens]
MPTSVHTPRTFTHLPISRPTTPLLDKVNLPRDLKTLSTDELCQLSDELREYLLYSVGQSGGHFGANLGVVELTVVLHAIYDTPYDKLVWDVGHQAYAHKVLTGRRDELLHIRAKGGLTAFPERGESEYDTFGVGHSSTSISAGLGMSLASRIKGENRKVVAIIGDGAMTGGMAFEAMNDAVQQNADLTVVLNDNDMSISQAIGGFSRHLARLWQRGLAFDIDKHGNILMIKREISPDDRRVRHYIHMANGAKETLEKIPAKLGGNLVQNIGNLFGKNAPPMPLSDKIAEKVHDHIFPDNLFKAIGFTYLGPFDGHDLPKLLQVFRRAKQLKGAVLIHVHTVKGKGFLPAEADPITYHAIGKLPKNEPPKTDKIDPASKPQKYSDVFGRWLMDNGTDECMVAITPAMSEGSGMVAFAKAYPDKFFDVAIAEQHAVTLAGGMATGGLKPVVAIYSTFLQRGYDQLIHDIALQNLDVTFAIDRAGLVGEDGATHAGVFDLAYLRCVPNVVIAAPSDEHECYHLLSACYAYQGTSAIRYPRGVGVGRQIVKDIDESFAIGRARVVWQSDGFIAKDKKASDKKIAMLAFGTRLYDALSASQTFAQTTDTPMTVVDMRWVKPLDNELIDELIGQGVTHFITVEEHQRMGGAGSAVGEYLASVGYGGSLVQIGIDDVFVAHGSHDEQLAQCRLDGTGILEWLNKPKR